MLTKLDLKKDLKAFYSPSAKKFELLKIPAMNFLMIDGHGNPNSSPIYREAVEALYSVSYTLKFTIKKEQGIDYPVMPLQGLWWAGDMSAFTAARKDDWLWIMMIMQPDIITQRDVDAAASAAQSRKDLPALSKLRFEPFEEGLVGQILYFGPYKDEGPTIQRLHDFIHESGFELSGKHHEIYLGDPRRSAPEKLKTIIRQPARKSG